MNSTWLPWLLALVVGLPAAALVFLSLAAWFRWRLPENAVGSVVGSSFTGALLACLTLAGAMIALDLDTISLSLGTWFQIGSYHFDWTLIGDRLSLPFATFSALLVGLIGAFSRRYLHQEPGFLRFYLLLTLFGAGVELVVLAGGLDLVFFGWELVGLSSALLIAFFHERTGPVYNGLRAFLTYRICDIGLLGAAVWLHHLGGSSEMTEATPWAGLMAPGSAGSITLVALLVLLASMGKSAQLPWSGWLPRAMEGPTPSSAIFYGAVSIHLGPYLLLRAAPLLERSAWATLAVVLVGGATALHATFVGRVQTDIKSVLAYASMTQVGLIFVEIGLGFRYLALVHILGHAAIRSLQILRSPSLLHDHHHLEQRMGSALPRTGGHLERWVPARWQPWLYRHALERGYFDAWLRDYALDGFLRFFRTLDALDRAWTRRLQGTPKLDQRSPQPTAQKAR